MKRNASQSHSCRYGEKLLDTFCRDNGGDSGLGYLVRHKDATPPFALATPRSIRRPLEYRCLTTSTDSLKSARRLLVRFNVFGYILNVLPTGRKIPHSSGNVKRVMRRMMRRMMRRKMRRFDTGARHVLFEAVEKVWFHVSRHCAFRFQVLQ